MKLNSANINYQNTYQPNNICTITVVMLSYVETLEDQETGTSRMKILKHNQRQLCMSYIVYTNKLTESKIKFNS